MCLANGIWNFKEEINHKYQREKIPTWNSTFISNFQAIEHCTSQIVISPAHTCRFLEEIKMLCQLKKKSKTKGIILCSKETKYECNNNA